MEAGEGCDRGQVLRVAVSGPQQQIHYLGSLQLPPEYLFLQQKIQGTFETVPHLTLPVSQPQGQR